MHISGGTLYLPGKLTQEWVCIIEEVLPGFESGINIIVLVCHTVIHDSSGNGTSSNMWGYEIEADTGDYF